MSFISFRFIVIFLPVVFGIYCIFRKHVKIQNFLLLCSSIFFYCCFDVKYVLLLFLSIAFTFLGAILGDKINKVIMLVALAANIFLLLCIKYMGCVCANINPGLMIYNCGGVQSHQSAIMVVGLSFYVFQSSSYLLDVYWGKQDVEKNIVDYALFVSFFGTIVSGPIQKARNFLPQIKEKRLINDEGIRKAILYFLWGAALKMIIADRLALFTNTVWDSYTSFAGFTLLIAALVYSVQIYLDFAGYSYMAIGVASLFGFTMADNFLQPYLSLNIDDFWRRWHVSLTSWFREYLYIPLGGNRKGTIRTYINNIIVFLVSGLWHGTEWSFIIWGGLHACYKVIGNLTEKWRVGLCGILKINRDTLGYRLWQRCFVFSLTSFAWIFFRASSLENAIGFIKGMFSCWNPWVLFDKSIYSLGLVREEWDICIWGMVIVLIVSSMKEKGKSILEGFGHQNIIFRYACYAAMFLALLIFGIYGPEYNASAFIYMGF